jgi:tetratricopeptide (TPR) repeat protein
MWRRCVLGLTTFCMLGGSVARAQVEVHIRDQKAPEKGTIKSELPRGLTLTGKKEIPSEDITDVIYDPFPGGIQAKISFYGPAQQSEKKSLDVNAKEADRKAALSDALKKYEEAASKLTAADAMAKSARRHLEYKIAMLKVRQVLEEGAAPEGAISDLKKFKTKNLLSWQIVRVLETLGRLQMGQKEYKGAEETFHDLAELDLSPEAKLDAQLLSVQAMIQDGRAELALKTVQAMPVKEGPLAGRIKVAQAQCLIGLKQEDKVKQARDLLKEVLKDSPDRQIKAAAHNALGVMHFDKGEMKEARWEFLWVDVVYNQDREEHAKALYYLWKTFEALNVPERAQECRNALLGGQFAGMHYQHEAQKAAKAP